METMKAVRCLAVGEPLKVQDVEKPQPGDDEVLVAVAGCGVCHTDLGFWQGDVPTRHQLPLTLGHEISGVVEDAGDTYAHMVGKEIIAPAVVGCGHCDLCTNGLDNICQSQVMPGNHADGGFAEYVLVPGHGLCEVSDRTGYELWELSVVADAVTTPYQSIKSSGLKVGDLAIVIGVGGIGTYAVQIAAAIGARVIAVDVDQTKLDLIAKFGADLIINSSEVGFKDLRKLVKSSAEKWGCKNHSWKIFECSGHPDGQKTAFGLISLNATLMVVGFTMDKPNLHLSKLMGLNATARGNWGCATELYPRALEMVTKAKMVNLKPFIKQYPMSEGPEVMQQVAEHKIQERVILVPDW